MGLAYDATGKRLFVADGNRVVVYDVASITNGENAVNVLGQSTFTGNAAATTQAGLSGPAGLAYDGSGNRLFVSDRNNNRIIVYDVASITNGENAVNVLGQTTFTGGTSAVTQSRLNQPTDATFNANLLYVADRDNHRVIVYDVASITNGENAVNVLGQTTFTSATGATSQAGLSQPHGVAINTASSLLYVADANGSRVIVYDVASITNGENAVNVLGQTTFTSSLPATSQSGFSRPVAAAYAAASSLLFVFDVFNFRIMVFDVASITNGENAVDMIGQYDDNPSSPSPAYTKGGENNGPNRFGFNFSYGEAHVVIDAAHDRLYVSDQANNRVLVYNLTAGDLLIDHFPDAVLGQTSLISKVAATTQAGLNGPAGLAIDSANNRLFVADQNNSRIMVFDVASITNGENAVNVLGQANFASLTQATTQAGLRFVSDVVYDGANNRLYAVDRDNNRVVTYDVASITNGENAVNVLGQTSFTVGTSGVTQAKLQQPMGASLDGTGNRLFVADHFSSRVVVYDVASITNGENAVNVLGQSTFTSSTQATTQSGMSFPRKTAYDPDGNRLFVADRVNSRVIVYDVASITNGENAVNVLGQSTFTANTMATSQSGLSSPYGVHFDAVNDRLYVVDGTNNRVMVFDVSLTPPTTDPTLSNSITASRLKAGASGTMAITFTLQNTLSGTLTVTFPVGFTVTAAATGVASSACLSSFGFTSSTLTAQKTSCSGSITLGGATVTNPLTPGKYHISWVNDDPGGGDIIIVDDDQVTVSGTVEPQLTFNAGSQTAACDGTFTGSGGALGLGTLTTGAVASSDVSSVPHVCARVTTNGSGGASVSVRSAFGALQSASVPADQIISGTATLSAGTAGYGICAGSGGGDSGRDATTPVGSTASATAPFNGTCSTSGHAVGALTTSPQTVWSVTSSSQNAFFRLYVKASISPTTIAHADYADTLTFIATGTY